MHSLFHLLSSILAVTCLALALPASAQYFAPEVIRGHAGRLQELRTLRGDLFYGVLLEQGVDTLLFRTESGLELRFPHDLVEHVKLASPRAISREERAAAWRSAVKIPDPGVENLLASPTGFSYPKGRGEFRNMFLFFNAIDVGLSDRITFNGVILLPAMVGGSLKYTAGIAPTVRLGMGAGLYTAVIDGGTAGHFFGILTKGTPDRFLNLTFGAVTNFTGSWEPAFSGGGSFRLHRHWRIMADLAFLPVDGAPLVLPSLTASWFNARNRVDFGAIVLNTIPLPIPALRYARRF